MVAHTLLAEAPTHRHRHDQQAMASTQAIFAAVPQGEGVRADCPRGRTASASTQNQEATVSQGGNPSGEKAMITLFAGVLIAVIIGVAVDQARAEPQTRFYDLQGRSIGTAASYGKGSVRYYDAR